MSNPISVAHIHSQDAGGGAEIAAYQLHKQLQGLGYDSHMLVGRKCLVDSDVIEIPRHKGPRGLLRLTRFLESKLGLQYLYAPGFRRVSDIIPHETNVLHIHSLHGAEGYADIGALPVLTRKWPAVLMLHDMWMLTGHCGYSNKCERWKTGCGQCPDLGIYPPIPKDGTRINWLWKRYNLQRSQLTVVCPSEWLAVMARKSPFFKNKSIRVIHNAVDTTTFKPGDKALARKSLGVPMDKFVVLVLANHLESPWKGVDHAISALNQINDSSVMALLVGQDSERAAAQLKAGSVAVSHQTERTALAMCYQAADVLVMPSLQEVFGMVAAESMACGTPVVAYATGGLPEVLGDNEGGILVRSTDIAGLSKAISALVRDPELLKEMSVAAARRAEEKFSLKRQAERFTQLYDEISTSVA